MDRQYARRTVLGALCAAGIPAVAGCQEGDEAPEADPEAAKAVVREFYGAIREGDVEAAKGLIAKSAIVPDGRGVRTAARKVEQDGWDYDIRRLSIRYTPEDAGDTPVPNTGVDAEVVRVVPEAGDVTLEVLFHFRWLEREWRIHQVDYGDDGYY